MSSIINQLFATITAGVGTTGGEGVAVPHDGNCPSLLRDMKTALDGGSGCGDTTGGEATATTVSLERDPLMVAGFNLVKNHRPDSTPYVTKNSALADRLTEIDGGQFGVKAQLAK